MVEYLVIEFLQRFMQCVYVAFHDVELNAVSILIKIEDSHLEDESVMIALFILAFNAFHFIFLDCYYTIFEFDIAFELVKQAHQVSIVW